METQERYALARPENGNSDPTDPADRTDPTDRMPLEPIEWCELAQVTVTLVYARKRANEHGSLLLKNVAFNPTPLFAEQPADPAAPPYYSDPPDMPYGRALEKLIAAGLKQAEEMK